MANRQSPILYLPTLPAGQAVGDSGGDGGGGHYFLFAAVGLWN